MNIFRQYTLKSLWKNKSRTAVTIIGIISVSYTHLTLPTN